MKLLLIPLTFLCLVSSAFAGTVQCQVDSFQSEQIANVPVTIVGQSMSGNGEMNPFVVPDQVVNFEGSTLSAKYTPSSNFEAQAILQMTIDNIVVSVPHIISPVPQTPYPHQITNGQLRLQCRFLQF